MSESSGPLAGDGPGGPGRRGHGQDERRAEDARALYAQARATRERSAFLAGQLQQIRQRASENWLLVRDAWGRAEQVRAGRRAVGAGPGLLRYSAYARLNARLASLPVIEQAKGVIMAQYGWPEEQAFEAMRRVSQQRNIKVRELAASIVARAQEGPAPSGARRAAPPPPRRRRRDDVRHFPAAGV